MVNMLKLVFIHGTHKQRMVSKTDCIQNADIGQCSS